MRKIGHKLAMLWLVYCTLAVMKSYMMIVVVKKSFLFVGFIVYVVFPDKIVWLFGFC